MNMGGGIKFVSNFNKLFIYITQPICLNYNKNNVEFFIEILVHF